MSAVEQEISKKDQIIDLYKSGTTGIADIVRGLSVRPSYAAKVLQDEGLINGYFDLHETASHEQNIYSRFFRGVLQFDCVGSAWLSVQRIDRLYNYFERLGDRAGQHQACVLALTGRNRARWSGKKEESRVFAEWLEAH
jgi:hypothetical protein